MLAPIQTRVRGVLGDIAPDDLGVTLPHEHLIIDLQRITRHPDHTLNDVEVAVSELKNFAAAGGRTLVEATSLGLGRDPIRLQRIAADSGVNVIMGCGWYRQSYYPPELDRHSTNQLADHIIRDLQVGADDTGIRAGIIGEIGSDSDCITGLEERVLRAAARAHLQTGVTVTTHAVRKPVGLDQLDILTAEGVDPNRVIIGHCDFCADPDYHIAIAERGAWLEFDKVAGKFAYEVERRIRWILNVIANGHIDRLLLSSDTCMKSDLRTYGGTGYDYVLTGFTQQLLSSGLSQVQIDRILIDNPRAALTGAGPA